MITDIKEVITHSGTVHADEGGACAILQLLYPDLTITRTRDLSILKRGALDPHCLVLDVGGQLKPEQGLFDHHQAEGAGFRRWSETGTGEWPYATAGLIWLHYGKTLLQKLHPELGLDDVAEVFAYLDEAMIKYLDATDCGVFLKTAGPTISGIVASLNPAWHEGEDEASAFDLILTLLKVLITSYIKRYVGKIKARDRVRKAEPALDGRVLVLSSCVPWAEVVAKEMPDVLFVAYPASGKWQVQCANNDARQLRIQFPAAWGGLSNQELAETSGVKDAVFCHRARHLAGANTLAGVLQLASQTMTQSSGLLNAA